MHFKKKFKKSIKPEETDSILHWLYRKSMWVNYEQALSDLSKSFKILYTQVQVHKIDSNKKKMNLSKCFKIYIYIYKN